MGREWFPLTFRDPGERWVGVQAAAPVLNAFLDAELARRQLPPSALALVGFSQGTMMALHVGLRRAVPPAAIVGYSGMLVVPEDVDPDNFAAEIKAKPPVLLIHGDQDPLIPVAGAVPGRTGAGLARASRPNGTSRPASATASTRKACARAANFSPANSPPANRAVLRVTPRTDFTILSRCPISSG